MLRSLISNLAKTTSHTCMAFIPSPLPCSLFPFSDVHTLLSVSLWSRVIPFSFHWIKLTMWLCYSRHKLKMRDALPYIPKKCVAWTDLCIKNERNKRNKTEGVRIYAGSIGRIPSYLPCYTKHRKPAPFQSMADMKYSTARITITTQRGEKKPCMLPLHTFNCKNLKIISLNRTPAPQQERLPLEPRLHL